MTMPNIESPAEENSRLEAEAAAQEAEYVKHVAALEDEGFGDGLHGALEVLLDPKYPYSDADRKAAILTVILGSVARRDIDRDKGRTATEHTRNVAEFHRTFGQPVETTPRLVDEKTATLRRDLLEEEFKEYVKAVDEDNLVEIADALGDIIYIAVGSALTYGIDLDAILREIHRSNMSKLGPDGKPIYRWDGKVLKPATYSPANIQSVFDAQTGDHLA